MKKLLILGFCALVLTGCGSQEIKYEGKTMPVDDVEEVIENKLELEPAP